MIYTEMYYHHMGRSHCLVFDNQFEVAKFLHRQNQSVQKTPFINMFCSNHQRWFKVDCKDKEKKEILLSAKYFLQSKKIEGTNCTLTAIANGAAHCCCFLYVWILFAYI